MGECDKKLSDGEWESFYKVEKNTKARKLNEEEVGFFFLTKEDREKILAERKQKQVEQEAKRKEFDKKVDAASGVKTEVAESVDKTLSSLSKPEPAASVDKTQAEKRSVDKTLPSSSQGVKEEVLTPALAAWEEVKKNMAAKKKAKEDQEEGGARKAAATESPPDCSESSSSSKKSNNKAGGAPFDKREARGTPAQAAQGSFDKREPEASTAPGALDKKAPCEPPYVPGGEKHVSDLDPTNKLEQTRSLASHIDITARQGTGRLVWRMKPHKKVAVDWYQTIRLKDGVPREHIQALKKLKLCGWEVTLMSFCGDKREQEVRGEIFDLRHEFVFDFVCFTRSKCGYNGKFQTCKRQGINYLIDDNESILWESSQGGMWVYPIETQYQRHSWSRWTYRSLPLAVDQLVQDVH